MNDPASFFPPPASRRQRLAQALQERGVAGAFLQARGRRWWPWRWLTVLVYHRVADVSDIGDMDPALIDATPAEFERQMRFLRQSFNPVGIDDIRGALVDGKPLPKNPVLVTFDDGYKDNLDNALPVLQRTGMRAVVFVSTSYVSQRRLFWWERVHILLARARRRVVSLEYPAALTLDLRGPRARAAAVRQVTRVVKDVFDLDLPRFLDELARAAGASWSDADERAYAGRAVMRWEDVAAAQRGGMEIQSHTCTHRVLQTLTDTALDAELDGSRAELEQRLGHPVHALAYPVGHSIAAEPRVRAALTRAGYALGFTTTPGVNLLSQRTDRLDLDRIPVDRGTPDNFFQGMVTLPWLAR